MTEWNQVKLQNYKITKLQNCFKNKLEYLQKQLE
jgi:hypothetical protein